MREIEQCEFLEVLTGQEALPLQSSSPQGSRTPAQARVAQCIRGVIYVHASK